MASVSLSVMTDIPSDISSGSVFVNNTLLSQSSLSVLSLSFIRVISLSGSFKNIKILRVLLIQLYFKNICICIILKF